jgi:hypothetical protein
MGAGSLRELLVLLRAVPALPRHSLLVALALSEALEVVSILPSWEGRLGRIVALCDFLFAAIIT